MIQNCDDWLDKQLMRHGNAEYCTLLISAPLLSFALRLLMCFVILYCRVYKCNNIVRICNTYRYNRKCGVPGYLIGMLGENVCMGDTGLCCEKSSCRLMLQATLEAKSQFWGQTPTIRTMYDTKLSASQTFALTNNLASA